MSTELYQIAQKLADTLPAWSLTSDQTKNSCYALLAGPDDAGMGIELDTRKTPARLIISGRYPTGYYPAKNNRPKITISSARSIEAIAADIERRFLPDYKSCYAQVREAQRAIEEQTRRDNTTRAEFAAILKTPPGVGEINFYGRKAGSIYAHIRVEFDHVEMKLSHLPIAAAREICQLLNRLEETDAQSQAI